MSRIAEADRELAAQPPRRAVQCKTCLALATLPKDEAADLQRLLNDPAKSGPHIARVLTECGIRIGKSSVNAHRDTHR